MVVLDDGTVFKNEKVPVRLPKISVTGWIALAAAGVAFGSLMEHGFSDNGFRVASQNAWRFAAFVFFAAMVAGPVGRLVPGLRRLEEQSRFVGWGFCACYGVYLITVLLPNAFAPDSMAQSAGVTLFVLFGAGVTLVMALALTPRMGEQAGEAARRALLGVSVIYFWLCYALMGLAHLSHPHRPDGFYGLSLSLMILALLVRFADNCRTGLRRPQTPFRQV